MDICQFKTCHFPRPKPESGQKGQDRVIAATPRCRPIGGGEGFFDLFRCEVGWDPGLAPFSNHRDGEGKVGGSFVVLVKEAKKGS